MIIQHVKHGKHNRFRVVLYNLPGGPIVIDRPTPGQAYRQARNLAKVYRKEARQ